VIGTERPGSGVRSPESAPAAAPRAAWLAVLAMLLALPILGHGCHRGDHDDEPAVAPVESRATHAESPP
jgi:hypothetical protein